MTDFLELTESPGRKILLNTSSILRVWTRPDDATSGCRLELLGPPYTHIIVTESYDEVKAIILQRGGQE